MKTLPRVPRIRLVALAGAMAAALAGLDAALLRLGIAAPVPSETLAAAHGILMVYGFLGTAIALERAVALRFVELVVRAAGHYAFVNHAMSLAEKGAHGVLEVTAP